MIFAIARRMLAFAALSKRMLAFAALSRPTLAFAMLLWPTIAAAAPRPGGLGGGEDLAIPVWRILFAFLLCAGIAYAVVLVLRRRRAAGIGGGAGRSLRAAFQSRARRIAVVETRRLSAHADVSLLREGGKEYLVVSFAGGCEVLRSGPTPLDGEAP